MNNQLKVRQVSKCLGTTFIIAIIMLLLGHLSFARAYAEGSISVTESKLTVDVNSTANVYLTAQSSDAVSWESSNEQAVTIESSTSRKSLVKGIGKGSSNIVATDANGNTSVCVVSVKTPNFSITGHLSMAVEETDEIYVQDGTAVEWRSSNEDIVSIESSSDSHVRVKAESVGNATITAIDKYGTEAKCAISIVQERLYINIEPNYGADDGDYFESIIFSEYNVSRYQPGWWDNDYYYHDSYWYYDTLYEYRISDADYNDSIAKCVSQNNNVVSVKNNNGYYTVVPKGVGKTNVVVSNRYGESISIKCEVTLNYFIDKECYSSYGNDTERVKGYSYKNVKYGVSKLTGITFNGAKIAATIRGKTYSAKANSSGYYSISIPKFIKINTPITIKTTQYGVTKTYTRKVLNNKPGITLASIKRSSTKATLTLKNVHKGDYVKLKVGKKTYTKKIKKDSKKITYKIKTMKQKKGQKVTATVYNKYKQKLSTKSKKIK